jgi:hypothetical protein
MGWKDAIQRAASAARGLRRRPAMHDDLADQGTAFGLNASYELASQREEAAATTRGTGAADSSASRGNAAPGR